MSNEVSANLQHGTSRPGRLMDALLPENVEIDGHRLPELLQQAAALASQVNFYDYNDTIAGDWKKFFESDKNIWVTLLANTGFGQFSNQYEQNRQAIYTADNEAVLAERFGQLLDTVYSLGTHLIGLIEKTAGVASSLSVQEELTSLLAGCRQLTATVQQYRTTTVTTGNEQTTIRQSVITLLPGIHHTFNALLLKGNQLISLAVYYTSHNPLLQQSYPPHLALFITFLQLYDHLRQHLNQLAKKHLDHYYHTVLGLQSRTEQPEQVHLLLEADVNARSIQLTVGEELQAEIPGYDDPIAYRLVQDAWLSKAVVQKIHTLFISNDLLFDGTDDNSQLRRAQVFAGEPAVVTPAQLAKATAMPVSWPLLGENQYELANDQRTMNDAVTGLLLASPLFYLAGGKRTIYLKFYLEDRSFKQFNDYIDSFAAAAHKHREVVLIEMLTDAFLVDFTTAEGWQPIKRCNIVAGSDHLEMMLQLQPDEAPITGYQAAFHGADYATSHPVLRLLINNQQTHNAFAFFRDLIIERIHIKCNVTGFRQVKLQNNIGNLSLATAFQPFGPLPAAGAYLDIKNINAFNRYTTAVTVRLEWMELPQEGFEKYYEGYDLPVNNASFKINVSGINDGQASPAINEQQQFSLFQPDRKNKSPQPDEVTVLTGIEVRKLGLSNAPLLEREDQQPDQFFHAGAIRLTLTSPSYAFGHAVYPRIFPEIAMHNARRFNTKRPVPHPPYTPRLKSVTVDYTLESAEAFRDTGDDRFQEPVFVLYHQYPFGYKKIYPAPQERTLYWLPRFQDAASVQVGLLQVQPGELLSLLFQLDEKNFHHTLHQADTVTWSYLAGSEWQPIDAKNIIADTTNNFINTGIVTIRMPDVIAYDHTIWPAGYCWLKASVSGRSEVRSRVITICAQAVTAERKSALPEQLRSTRFVLPPGSIKKFTRNKQGILATWQVFSSFEGRPAENDAQYYTRISERLRHKQRLLTVTDIEQMVLEQFPALSMVKCFGTEYQHQPVYPGVNLQVIVVPEVQPGNAFQPDEPKVNLAMLFAIKKFLTRLISPFIQLEVGNPVYEQVKIICDVRFAETTPDDRHMPQVDSGANLRRLTEDIKTFLCPWLYTPGVAIGIGSRIYLSEILTFIKMRPFLSEVTGFSVVHFFRQKDLHTGAYKMCVIDSARQPVEYLQGSIPEAVLVPSAHHLIQVLPQPSYMAATARGVRDFRIGGELLVAEAATPPPAVTRLYSRTDDEDLFDLTIHQPIS